ncbi:amidinotransferase [Candidatus Dependentiae bacterium Noda2021]|nr:amidinotransferase [Candidatus Dependentiae bacterium Noda2021]
MIRYLVLMSLLSSLLYSQPKTFGGHSMVAPLQRVLVKRPDTSFGVSDIQKWHYTAVPDVERAQEEHDDFVATLKQEGVEVLYHLASLPDHADALFVHDPVLITNKGAIILSMGKALRRGEEDAIEKTLNSLQIPTLYKLHGDARAEGGDIVWLDDSTLAIGRGFRTNDEGIRQITNAVTPLGVKVITVDLPYDQGEHACLHLQSLISLVDYKIALVYKKLLAVPFITYLEKQGFTLLEVPEHEYQTMGPNVLAIAPKVCLTIQCNPDTKKTLELVGCKVYTYKGDEISLKAEGGATCLTRPLLRQ